MRRLPWTGSLALATTTGLLLAGCGSSAAPAPARRIDRSPVPTAQPATLVTSRSAGTTSGARSSGTGSGSSTGGAVEAASGASGPGSGNAGTGAGPPSSSSRAGSGSSSGGVGVAGATCANGQLQVSTGYLGGGMSHGGVVLTFTNTSASTCVLGGYPGVAGLDSSGRQVTQAIRSLDGYLGGYTGGGSPPDVPLSPGASASATAQGTDEPEGDAGSCPALSGLLVTPPDTTAATRVAAAPPDCSGLTVTPIVAGSTGSGHNG